MAAPRVATAGSESAIRQERDPGLQQHLIVWATVVNIKSSNLQCYCD